MKIYDGSGEPFIETEADQAFIDLFTRLQFENETRYKRQAEQLLREGLLLVVVDNLLVKYLIEDKGVSYRFSGDHGVTFSNELGFTPLHWRKRRQVERLVEKFAHSEARATLQF